MSLSASAFSAVSAAAPHVPEPIVSAAVEQQFGLSGHYTSLIGERDQNLKLTSGTGRQFVVKLTNLAATSPVNAFRIATLLHLADLGSPKVPQLVLTRDGRTSGEVVYEGHRYGLTVVSYLAGDLLASMLIDRDLARDFGAKLAAMDAALHGFRHDGEHPVLLWDLQRVTELRDLLPLIDDPAAGECAAKAIDDFEANVAPELPTLRTQVIHGDANPENILVDRSRRRVSGIIDFGDMLRAPLIFDTAIAAAYLRTDSADVLELIAPFVAGYNRELPLADAELAVLYDLVRARLATTITLLYWRLGARAEDDLYRQKTLRGEADAVRFLQALDTLGRSGFERVLRQALQ